MTVLFADDVHVHYGFVFLGPPDTDADLMDARRGQRNGLCGAAIPGVLSLITGLHTGAVPLAVEWHDREPAVDPQWEEVVEVPFTPAERELTLTSFDHYVDVELPAVGSLRARYCAQGMDAGHQQDTVLDGERAPDRYLLQLWPADPAPDAVVRLTSANAAYWHREARPRPPCSPWSAPRRRVGP